MMKSCNTTLFQDKSYGKSERCPNTGSVVPCVLTYLLMASIFCFYFLYSSNPLTTLMPNQDPLIFANHSQQNQVQEHAQITKIPKPKPQEEQRTCDLFKGHWVPSSGGSSYYTNSRCPTMQDSKNCFKHGRKDTDFLNWKWKPHQCELPRFHATTFLDMVRGKKMAFIGDSVSRNHFDSLLCILSQEETPKNIHKDSEDRYLKWYFPNHDFTLMMIWSRFLIVGQERILNGTRSSIFDMHLDKVDNDWAQQLPILDYAIISDGHWFFRIMYLYEAGNLKGCVYCQKPNVTNYNSDFTYRMALRTTLRFINSCEECRKMVTVLRTFAPSHFENGNWNTGGYCNRTFPLSEREIGFERYDWQMRRVLIEEFEKARNEGSKVGQRFEVIDVTSAMLMRPDGHPGEHWGNKYMRGYNDCTHWCLPGPIDLWSELLHAVLKRV